jgi:hypothetical protein
MTAPDSQATEPVDDSRVDHRAALLPEERGAGSDDPQLEARLILEDSDARTADPEGTKHASHQTPDRDDARDR